MVKHLVAEPVDSKRVFRVLQRSPESVELLVRAAEQTGLVLTGPQRAFLIQGDDKLGALAELHRKLADGQINVYASSGVTDGRGGYGYILYVRSEHYEDAACALGI